MEYMDIAEALQKFPCTKKLKNYFHEKNIIVEVSPDKEQLFILQNEEGKAKLLEKVKIDCCARDGGNEKDCRMEHFIRENARLIRDTQAETLRLPLEFLKKNHPDIYQDPDKLADYVVKAIYGEVDYCKAEGE